MLNKKSLFLLILLCFVFSNIWSLPELSLPTSLHQRNISQLLKGIKKIHIEGVPGKVLTISKSSFPVLSDNKQQTVAAASNFGKGKVFAFAHSYFLDPKGFSYPDNEKLLKNSFDWLNISKTSKIFCFNTPTLGKYLEKKGYLVKQEKRIPSDLKSYKLLILQYPWLINDTLTIQEIKQVQHFVKNGGSLITSAIGWVYHSYFERGKAGLPIQDFAANQLLMPMGLYFQNGYADAKSLKVNPENILQEHPFSRLKTILNDTYSAKSFTIDKVTSDNLFLESFFSIHPHPEKIVPKKILKEIFAHYLKNSESLTPSPENPIKISDNQKIMEISLINTLLKYLPPQYIFPLPSSLIHPGALDKNIPRLSKNITLDLSKERWISTGLYAPAGEPISIEINGDINPSKLAIRIGSHSDNLIKHASRLKEWKRWPDLSYQYPLTTKKVTVTSPHGGLIYLVNPKSFQDKTLDLKISGAVEAIYYKKGTTSIQEWKAQLEKNKAPWGEIEGDRLIITVPISALKKLQDPEKLINWWDDIVALYPKLAMISTKPYQERFVCDIQISMGYMHSGYPIMTWMDVQEFVLGMGTKPKSPYKEILFEKGGWGHFHELGHNHQSRDWTYEGTGEVTVNLFTLYAMDKKLTIIPWQHPWLVDGYPKAKKYIESNQPFSIWQKDPQLGIIHYVQLIRAFGWETFQKAFEFYQTLPKEKKPKTDAEKRDLWLVTLSKAANKNLGPFFTLWKIPVSQKALRSIKTLPAWRLPDTYFNP